MSDVPHNQFPNGYGQLGAQDLAAAMNNLARALDAIRLTVTFSKQADDFRRYVNYLNGLHPVDPPSQEAQQ